MRDNPDGEWNSDAAASAAEDADSVESLLERLKEAHPVHAGLLGNSPAIASLLRKVRTLARSEVPVLVEGEVGSGKECVARAIHLNSDRSRGPFVAESCALLRDALALRALFGHVRGAYTGATGAVGGLLEAADGGTLFLDEVSELALPIQGALLRALGDGEYRPLGCPDTRRSRFRLIAATSCDLRIMVRSGLFRRDLYYRLRGAVLRVPPLRERRGDLPALVEHLVGEECRALRRPRVGLNAEARRALAEYGWPGNVRELKNELRQAIAFAQDGEITAACFQFLSEPPVAESVVLGEAGAREARAEGLRRRLGSIEADAIRDALRQAQGNKAEAARRLGLTRRTLYRRLRSLGDSGAP